MKNISTQSRSRYSTAKIAGNREARDDERHNGNVLRIFFKRFVVGCDLYGRKRL